MYVDSRVPMIQSKQDYQVVGLPKVSCRVEMWAKEIANYMEML